MKNKSYIFFGLLLIGSLGVFALAGYYWTTKQQSGRRFDGMRAYDDIRTQLSFGPRTPDSTGHAAIIRWITDELESAGWDVDIQDGSIYGFPLKNIVASRENSPGKPWIIVGAHYDTRFYSDKDPDVSSQRTPVPGANDGGSGVAVLLELARTLPKDLNKNVWLVFFDEEDNGMIGDRRWAMGAEAFVDSLTEYPDHVVVLDMIGDRDLQIYLENNSDPMLSAEIWAQAAALGHVDKFIPVPKYSMLDDHIPFLDAGISAVDIIDFDFPYHHTTADTLDKVSAKSLQVVGETILMWLTRNS